MKIGVYGTLKKGHHWHQKMIDAQAKFLGEDYIEIRSLKKVNGDMGEHTYPEAIFSEGTGKYIFIEIYEISEEMRKLYIDPLEGYTGGKDDHYTLIAQKSLLGEQIYVYSSNGEPGNDTEIFFIEQKGDKRFYNWKDI